MTHEDRMRHARSLLWKAWQGSSEELASQAVATLDGLGMLVPEGGAAELERLRARVDELEAERAAVTAALEPRWDLHLYTQMHVLEALTTARPKPAPEEAPALRADGVYPQGTAVRVQMARHCENPHHSDLHHDYADSRDLPAPADTPESLR